MSKSFVNNIASDQSFSYLPTKAKLALALDTAKGTRSSSDNNSSNLHKYSNIPLGVVHKLRLQEYVGGLKVFANIHTHIDNFNTEEKVS